jgi:hypothetical protein
VTLRPCLDCGVPSASTRCTAHRGYDSTWERLSKKARKLQPFCTDCGSTENLQADHSLEAWERRAAGKPIRLRDIDVVCGPCNVDRGQARPDPLQHNNTRRTTPDTRHQTVGRRPPANAQLGPASLLSSYTPEVVGDARGA